MTAVPSRTPDDRFLGTMTILLPLRLDVSHGDYALLTRIEKALYRGAGGQKKFERDIPELLRQAIDEVIDPSRSKRFTLKEIEKTEKTYLARKSRFLCEALSISRGADTLTYTHGFRDPYKGLAPVSNPLFRRFCPCESRSTMLPSQ